MTSLARTGNITSSMAGRRRISTGQDMRVRAEAADKLITQREILMRYSARAAASLIFLKRCTGEAAQDKEQHDKGKRFSKGRICMPSFQLLLKKHTTEHRKFSKLTDSR